MVYYTVLLPCQPTFLPSSIGMMIAGIGWLYMLLFDFKNVVFNKKSFIVFLFLAMYFLSGISSIDDPRYKEIMRIQIPFLFWGLPFVFYYPDFKEKILPFLIRCFVLSSTLSALIFIFFFIWIELNDISIEYSKRSPYFFLPVHYLGMYYNGSLVFLIWGNIFENKKYSMTIFIVLSTAIILLASRMQWLIYFVLLIAFTTNAFIQKKITFKPKIFLLFLISLFLFYQIPEVKRRVLETSDEYKSLSTVKNNKQTNHRKFIWNESLSVIKETPLFGFKPGVADQLLMQRLSLIDEKFWDGTQVYYLRDGNYNFHNQFLQAIAERGIGMLGLIGMLLFTFFSSHLTMTRLFVAVVFLSMLTESILQRQSGVFFVAFFMPFLAAYGKD